METFEFINICQSHGMPKVMGILTHMDERKQKRAKSFSKFKRYLKKRFWVDIYNGAKLFYLTKIINNEYQYQEITNLCRFITVMKLRPLEFRNNHSYILADRMEDITNPSLIKENGKTDRNIVLYGYMRGCPMKTKDIHIAGIGDFENVDISLCPDPCELPDKEQNKARRLDMRQQRVYAPFSGVGRMLFDKDAVYLDKSNISSLNTNESSGQGQTNESNEERQEQNELLDVIYEIEKPIDEKMKNSEIQLVSKGRRLVGENFDAGEDYEGDSDGEDSGSDTEMDAGSEDDEDENIPQFKANKKLLQSDSEDDQEMSDLENDEDISAAKWRVNIAEKAIKNFEERLASVTESLQKLIYDTEATEETTKTKKTKIGDSMFKKSIVNEEIDLYDAGKIFDDKQAADNDVKKPGESAFFPTAKTKFMPKHFKNLFVSGNWSLEEGDAQKRLDQDDDLYGDFEDLETGERFEANEEQGSDDSASEGSDMSDGDGDDESETDGTKQRKKRTKQEKQF